MSRKILDTLKLYMLLQNETSDFSALSAKLWQRKQSMRVCFGNLSKEWELGAKSESKVSEKVKC